MNDKAADPVRVGVIGASPGRGWAITAHLPALAALPGLRTVAVASTRTEGAREVADRWAVPHAFGDPYDLISCPDVEVVAISVKTPDHAPLARAAVEAGKHIYCEWPLGVDVNEARELAELAEGGGIHHLIGMQAYEAPGARFVAQLVQQGVVGIVNAASLVLLTPTIGGVDVAETMAYTTDRSSGTNLMTTSTGHALAALSRIVGDLERVSAAVEILHPEVRIIETGDAIANDAPNEVAIIGHLSTGQPVTIAVHGGTPIGAPRFTLHIVGTEGALVIRPATLGDSINVGDWIVALARGDGSLEELAVPDDADDLLPSGPAKNVARMYSELGTAVRGGPPVVMNFRMALRFHEVIDAIERSAGSGVAQNVR